MKKYIFFITAIIVLVLIAACTLENPAQPALNIPVYQPLFSRMVAIGNSLTMGIQSAGIKEDFQKNCYPYLIAKQTGNAAGFEMPLVDEPGIGEGGNTPMYIDQTSGEIVSDPITVNPLTLLLNSELPRPYDNLGIAGFDLNDALNTVSGELTDIVTLVLRNLNAEQNLGFTSQIEQAIMLNPKVILLWLGNNDVLGAALAGGDLTQITPVDSFQARYTRILTKIGTEADPTLMVMANIPNVTDIPYVNILDHIVKTTAWGTGPVLFGSDLQPINFDPSGTGELYIPIKTDESSVEHVTLVGLQAYQTGIGVPTQADLEGMGLSTGQAAGIIGALSAGGLTPSGTPMPGSMTITTEEAAAISGAVTYFNAIIAGIATRGTPEATDDIPVVDINTLLGTLNSSGLEGFTGYYVLMDRDNTAFSLDGVHPNNGGQALIANAFIDKINQVMTLQHLPTIPRLNTDEYKGQYTPGNAPKIAAKTDFSQVRKFFE